MKSERLSATIQSKVNSHLEYAEWMLEENFPEDTRNILSKFLRND